MRKMTHNEMQLLWAILGLFLLGGLVLFGSAKKSAALRLVAQADEKEKNALHAFDGATDTARAIFVYDATNSKVLYEKNADTALPLASLTKLMTAIVVNQVFTDTQTIPVNASAVQETGDNGLRAGEKWRRDELVGLMLVSSSNDAAVAFKEFYEARGASFISAMNDEANKIGLEHSTFWNPSGLDDAGHPGAIGSARDVSKLILSFIDVAPEAARATVSPDSIFHDTNGHAYHVSNTNDLSSYIENLLASKTGYTNLAQGNLAIVYRVPIYGNKIAIVVLGSSREGRFIDITNYMKAVDNYFGRVN